MKLEDLEVGGLYEWMKDLGYTPNPRLGLSGPFLVTSITAHADPHQGSLVCINASGRRLGPITIAIAKEWQPLE